MTIWVTSDTHFNHKNVIKYSNRPFANEQQMNEHMICMWNDRVRPDDTIYHLGDVYFAAKNNTHVTMDELMARLNGHKHLITGNHDIERHIQDGSLVPDHWGWESVSTYQEVKFGKSRFVMCHYPLETWRNAHRGWFMIHGHCHNTLKRVIPHRMDVGVDSNDDYAPFSLEELRDYFKLQGDYEPTDHHGD